MSASTSAFLDIPPLDRVEYTMKIAASTLALASQQQSMSLHSVSEKLRIWSGERPRDNPGGGNIHLSEAARRFQEPPRTRTEVGDKHELDDYLDTPQGRMIAALIEQLTGHKIRARKHHDEHEPRHAGRSRTETGFGLEYDRHELYQEAEQMRFEAAGVVQTADGREIAFNLQLDMARQYVEESSVSLRAGNALTQDPLVIQFAGSSLELTDTRSDFDLDADGQTENIAFVGSGSGFLAFDRNADGVINDGSELFGPNQGDGFAELAAYDQDRNGWIDEGDAVFDSLRIWTKAPDGSDALRSLREFDIGAIALARVASPFDLKDGENILQGRIRSSGVYLTESGTAGAVRQIDLRV